LSWLRWQLGCGAELPPETDDASWLAPGELARAAGFGPQRRHDFRLGRWVAKQALRAWLGPRPPASLEIEAGPDGAPRLRCGDGAPPCGISLSHRADLALCTLFPRALAVGCDLERIEPRSDAFLEDFFTPAERARVAAAAGEQRWIAANLIWSAKESCLKALRTGLSRDTRSIEIDLAAPGSSAAPAGWLRLSAVEREAGGEAASFGGWWRVHQGFVLTVLARGDVVAPVELSAGPLDAATSA